MNIDAILSECSCRKLRFLRRGSTIPVSPLDEGLRDSRRIDAKCNSSAAFGIAPWKLPDPHSRIIAFDEKICLRYPVFIFSKIRSLRRHRERSLSIVKPGDDCLFENGSIALKNPSILIGTREETKIAVTYCKQRVAPHSNRYRFRVLKSAFRKLLRTSPTRQTEATSRRLTRSPVRLVSRPATFPRS